MGAVVYVLIVAAVVAAIPVGAILAGGGRPSRSPLTFLVGGVLVFFSVGTAWLFFLLVASPD
jgi:hypothetical protein